MAVMWSYRLGGAEVAKISRDEAPYIGMRVTWVGRLGVPAKAEHFIVNGVDCAAKTLALEPGEWR